MPADVAAYNRELIAEFRAKGGALGERPLLLLTTVGARSGQERTSPMMYIPDGDRLLVVASNVGAAKHPAWFHNLVANPRVTVEVAGETYPADAVVTSGEERDRLFARIGAEHPFFLDYQTKTERVIPVVALVRAG